MMNPVAIGKKLRELRGDRNGQSVADAIGISRSALAMYELGDRIPRDEIKLKLCKYYGVDINIFFTDEQHETCCNAHNEA